MEKNNSASGGIGFSGLLAVAFIVLKLCGVITWSWWWVLSPIWIPFGLVIIGLIIFGLSYWRKYVDDKRRLASGMNEWAWKRRKKSSPDSITEAPISKWQQRINEIQKRNNPNNK